MNTKQAETPAEKMVRAYSSFDVALLKEAIAEGADVNITNSRGWPLFDSMLVNWSWDADELTVKCPEDTLVEFMEILIQNGLDVNCRYPEDSSLTVFERVATLCTSDKVLELLLRNGCNPNGRRPDLVWSPYEELLDQVELDEYLGYPDLAEMKRRHAEIGRRYGAKTRKELRKVHRHRSAEEKKAYKAWRKKLWKEGKK